MMTLDEGFQGVRIALLNPESCYQYGSISIDSMVGIEEILFPNRDTITVVNPTIDTIEAQDTKIERPEPHT